MAYRPKRIFWWMLVALLGFALCGVSRFLARPAASIVLLGGLVIGIGGVAGARLNTNWYNPNE